MIPTLYDSDSINGHKLGYGKIVNVLRCEITESMGGEYSLEFDYPVYGEMYNDLLGEKSIIAAGPNGDTEVFDIYKKSVPIDGVVTFYCNHVSRRMAKHLLTEDLDVKTSFTTLHIVPPASTSNVTFRVINNTGAEQIVPITTPRSLLSALAGDTDSLAEQGFEVYFVSELSPGVGDVYVSAIVETRRGADNHASVRFGYNMVDIEYITDETETYNAFLPYWTDGDGNVYKPTGNALAQPTTPITPIKAVPLDLTSVFVTQPTSAQMLNYATALLDSTTPWIPAKTVTVDMINGTEIDIHAVPVSMGDTVHVYWTDANISEDLRMVGYKYDVLGETYTEITLGTQETEFVATTGDFSAVSDGGSSLSTPKAVMTANLPLSWTDSGNGYYTCTPTLSGGITATSKIDLQPTEAQIIQLQADGVTALYIENNAGTLTAYSVGTAPSVALTMQCTVEATDSATGAIGDTVGVSPKDFRGIPKTYTSNSYVTETNWNRCFAETDGRMVVFVINLNISNSPGTTFREIGRFTLPRNLDDPVQMTIAGQNNGSSLLLSISVTGVVQIYSAGSATGFYRGYAFGFLV